jgi:phenylpyruvate tautomerase PptA (4-oxalocrotonate tautomerase family)
VGDMPVIQIQCNINLAEESKQKILHGVVRLVSDEMKKPGCDVMALFSTMDMILMGESFEPAVFIDFRFVTDIGLDSAQILCEEFYRIFKKETDIDASRIYVNFVKVDSAYAWRFIGGNAVCPISGKAKKNPVMKGVG